MLDERPHPVQLQLLRAMTDVQRLRLGLEVTETVLEMARAELRRRHPEATQRELLRHLAAHLYGRELADQVYPPS